MTTNRHSIEFQDQALSKARQRGTRSVQDVANELNMAVGTLRKWISKSNRKHEVGGPAAQLPDDLPAQSWSPAQRLLGAEPDACHARDTAACLVPGEGVVRAPAQGLGRSVLQRHSA